MSWRTIDRPGYFSVKRDEIHKGFDEQHGPGNWRIAYQWGESILPRKDGIQIYEDGYYEFLKSCPETLEWLLDTAFDVYDTAPSNVKAGLDYEHQETPNNQVHDIAIRRAVMRLGEQFKGDHLVEVRWTESEGFRLCPGIVPFHLPNMIYKGEFKNVSGKKEWWKPGTIEDFYQKNKVLQVKSI